MQLLVALGVQATGGSVDPVELLEWRMDFLAWVIGGRQRLIKAAQREMAHGQPGTAGRGGEHVIEERGDGTKVVRFANVRGNGVDQLKALLGEFGHPTRK